MKTRLLAVMLIVLSISVLSFAQEVAETSVEDIQICTSIDDRTPVGSGTSFPGDVEKLYCFTKIMSSQDEGSVFHVWLHNDRVMARIELPLKAKTWRTWSSKKILPSWTGKWRVDVESIHGFLLASKEFEIE